MFEYFFNLFTITIPSDNIRAILNLFGLANSIFTFVITNIMQRPSMTRWRQLCVISLIALWLSAIFCLLDLIQEITIEYSFNSANIVKFSNVGTKLGVVIWSVGLSLLLFLVPKIILIPLIPQKSWLKRIRLSNPFSTQEEKELFRLTESKFGVNFIDEDKSIKLRFPLLVMAQSNTPGLLLSQHFICQGLAEEEGLVYLSFTRPVTIIIKQLKKRMGQLYKDKENWWKHLVIIDCYSPLYSNQLLSSTSIKKKFGTKFNVRYCDPRDPIEVANIYKSALYSLQENRVTSIRSIYDSLSDFLSISDQEIVVAYLRHMIVFEELNNIKALYIIWPEVLQQPLNDQYMAWFSNTLLRLERLETGNSLVTLEGVGYFPNKFTIDGQLNPIQI